MMTLEGPVALMILICVLSVVIVNATRNSSAYAFQVGLSQFQIDGDTNENILHLASSCNHPRRIS